MMYAGCGGQPTLQSCPGTNYDWCMQILIQGLPIVSKNHQLSTSGANFRTHKPPAVKLSQFKQDYSNKLLTESLNILENKSKFL